MRTWSSRIAAAVLLILLLSHSRAAAASLGGLVSQQLGSFALAGGTGAPVVTAWENFDAPTGTAIGGTVTDGGGLAWSTPRCAFTVQANQAGTTSGDCPALLPTTSWHQAVEVTLTRGGSAFDAGLVVNANAAATQFLTTEWTSNSNGSLELWRYSGGGWALLGTVTNLYPGGIATAPTTITLRLELTSAHVLRASINGSVVASATLSAADQTLFENATHTAHGIYGYFDGASRWNDLHVESTT